jgi:hypothetical protein
VNEARRREGAGRVAATGTSLPGGVERRGELDGQDGIGAGRERGTRRDPDGGTWSDFNGRSGACADVPDHAELERGILGRR